MQIAFKRRSVGHRKNSIVPFVLTFGYLQNFEYSNWIAYLSKKDDADEVKALIEGEARRLGSR